MKFLTDTDGAVVTDNLGNPIYVNHIGVLSANFSDLLTAYVGAAGVYEDWMFRNLFSVDRLQRYLTGNFYWFPMVNISKEAGLIEFLQLSSASEVGGDIGWEPMGFYSGGAAVLDSGLNLNSRISSISDFSMGVFSFTDDDAGVEIGASDGTNEISISCKNGGSAVFNVGTVTISQVVDDGIGHYVLHCLSGTATGYKRGIENYLQTIGTDTIAGAKPNYNAYINGRNASGTEDNQSAKIVGFAWLYNGALTSDELIGIETVLYNYGFKKGII